MTRLAPYLLVAAFIALFIAPWPVPAVLALILALPVPAAPLALGLAFDALYGPPGLLPLATLLGAFATLAALLVRRRLLPGIMAA